MSEPMSTGDIEDVLSSIRRLVSEDLRPVSQKTTAQKDSVPNPATSMRATSKHGAAAAGGKLLLTPALRVVSAQADVHEAPYAFVEDAHPEEPALLLRMPVALADSDIEDAFAGVAATHGDEEDWLPETNDEAEIVPGWAPEQPAQRGAEASLQPASDVNRVVSEIAAGVSAADEDWEPETGDGPAISWQAPDWGDEAEVIEDEPLTESAAKAIADKAEAAAVAEIMASAAGVIGETSTSGAEDGGDDLRFDEVVLRDLVRDLIHQELSGPLGERITRNVRKLVRSEINRVRTTSTLD